MNVDVVCCKVRDEWIGGFLHFGRLRFGRKGGFCRRRLCNITHRESVGGIMNLNILRKSFMGAPYASRSSARTSPPLKSSVIDHSKTSVDCHDYSQAFLPLVPRQSPETKLGEETIHAMGHSESSCNGKLVMKAKVQCRNAALRRIKRASRNCES